MGRLNGITDLMDMSLSKHAWTVFSFIWETYVGMKLLDLTETLCLTFRGTVKLFFNAVLSFSILNSKV